MRENVRTKADRLLVHGRVSVLRVDDEGVLASVKGDTATYRVRFDRRWTCECEARGTCSHAIATARVVVVRTEGGTQP